MHGKKYVNEKKKIWGRTQHIPRELMSNIAQISLGG